MRDAARRAPCFTTERYFDLVDRGEIGPDDRVELLEGVIVSMSPQSPRHAAVTMRAHDALRRALGPQAVLRVQLPFLAGPASVPEPDVAVVPGSPDQYLDRHPDHALLILEIADSSLLEDRLTKSAIYAAAGVPEYWVVDLRATAIEVFRDPDRDGCRYGERLVVHDDRHIELVAFPGTIIAASDVLPPLARSSA